MEQISATISVMDVLAITLSAMKCEICFLLQCHQSAKVRTAFVKRVDARFGLAHVPGRSSRAVFNGIHDAYIVLLCFVLSPSKILADREVHWPLTLKITTKTNPL